MYDRLTFPEGIAWLPFHPSDEQTHYIQYNPLPVLKGADKPIDALAICSELEADLEAAMAKYQGYRFEVSGVVTAAGVDPHNLPAVQLSDRVGGKIGVQCVFNKDQEDAVLSAVKPGDSVVIRGNYLVMSTGLGLIMKCCEVIK